jgi:hypothetical protein
VPLRLPLQPAAAHRCATAAAVSLPSCGNGCLHTALDKHSGAASVQLPSAHKPKQKQTKTRVKRDTKQGRRKRQPGRPQPRPATKRQTEKKEKRRKAGTQHWTSTAENLPRTPGTPRRRLPSATPGQTPPGAQASGSRPHLAAMASLACARWRACSSAPDASISSTAVSDRHLPCTFTRRLEPLLQPHGWHHRGAGSVQYKAPPAARARSPAPSAAGVSL